MRARQRWLWSASKAFQNWDRRTWPKCHRCSAPVTPKQSVRSARLMHSCCSFCMPRVLCPRTFGSSSIRVSANSHDVWSVRSMTGTVSRVDVEEFRAVICRRLGLHFDDSKLEFLEDILRTRLKVTGRQSAGEYLSHSWSREETHALAQVLTVAETYFFRNYEQFRALQECAVPSIVRASENPRELRVLSAACASGEEAYSLAIVIRESLPGSWGLAVTGIDLNPAMLEKARAAHYTEWSLRATPAELRERYFHRDGTEFVLDERCRRMVSFQERNLIEEDTGFWQPHSLDIVFCRNVTMYFPLELTQGVIARIARALVPGGYLFLGHAETLRGISNEFHLCHTHDTFYYQRKQAGEYSAPLEREMQRAMPVAAALPEMLAEDISWVDAIGQASARIAALSDKGSKAPAQNVSSEITSASSAPV